MVKVIGFNENMASVNADEREEVYQLAEECRRPKVFGWTSPKVVKHLRKAQKWVSRGWYKTPLMRIWLEENTDQNGQYIKK